MKKHTYGQRDKETWTNIHTDIDTKRQMNKQTYGQTDRRTDIKERNKD